MNGLMNISTRACGGQLSGKAVLPCFSCRVCLVHPASIPAPRDRCRHAAENGTSHIIRLLWGGFGLIAGSGLVLVAIGLGVGAFRLSNNFTQTKRRLIKSLVVLLSSS